MNTTKEIEKSQAAINKIIKQRILYVENVKSDRAKQAQQVVNDAGGDAQISVSDELTQYDLNNVEILYNEPIAQLKERIRQLQNIEKKKRSDEIPGIIDKLDNDITELKVKLQAKESERAGLIAQKRDIDNNLKFRGGANGAVVYTRCAALVFDARVNAPSHKMHYDHILNYC